jgi:hypothetical protein
LKELCHCAARESIREVIKETAKRAVMTRQNTPPGNTTKTETPKQTLRPMTVQDLKIALTKVKRTGQDAAEYERKQFDTEHRDDNNKQKGDMLQQLAALSQLLSQQNDDRADAETDSDGGSDVPQL